MYIPQALLSCIFHQICRFILSLYTAGRLVTLPCKISVPSPVYASTVFIASKGKVWSEYIYTSCSGYYIAVIDRKAV